MLQMYDTREIEMRARLSQRRVDLVPPLRGNGTGLFARLAALVTSRTRRARTPARHSTVPSVPCP